MGKAIRESSIGTQKGFLLRKFFVNEQEDYSYPCM